MEFNDIESVCAALNEMASQEKFLEHSVSDIEKEADRFVEAFALEHGLTAHTLSAYRWYFQSDEGLLEDGFVELLCKTRPFTHKGKCIFECVNVSETDMAHKSIPA